MMLLKICGLTLICAFSVIILKKMHSEIAIFPVIACIIGAFTLLIGENLTDIVTEIINISTNVSINEYVVIILKALGIAYITFITAEICNCANEQLLVNIVEIAGKLELLTLSMPLVSDLINISLKML